MEPLATADEVAKYYGVSKNTLYAWRYQGRGPRARRLGKHLRYAWSDVRAWAEQQADAPTGPPAA
jgi:excisionase family DNA binding protein